MTSHWCAPNVNMTTAKLCQPFGRLPGGERVQRLLFILRNTVNTFAKTLPQPAFLSCRANKWPHIHTRSGEFNRRQKERVWGSGKARRKSQSNCVQESINTRTTVVFSRSTCLLQSDLTSKVPLAQQLLIALPLHIRQF